MVMLYILLLFAVYVVFLLSSFLARSIALYNHLNFALLQVLLLILIDFSIEFLTEVDRYFLVILLLLLLDFEFYKVHSELVLSLPT